MSRYTKKQLELDLKEFNTELSQQGLNYSFKYQSRNGYHAVDLYKSGRCVRCVECNETPLKIFDKVEFEFSHLS